jgi:predicted RND superfamily exporter protein
MQVSLTALYDRLILGRPVVTLLVVSLLMAWVGFFARDFKLDASPDTLLLESDEDLRYYRFVQERYGTEDFLVITYTPHEELFSPESLADLRRLRDSLLQIERVESVVSILDAPLVDSPRVSLEELQENVRTLESPDTDANLARAEFLQSPLYRDLILSADAKTTALQVIFRRDETYNSLLNRRSALHDKRRISAETRPTTLS